jgi:hypothetical protein
MLLGADSAGCKEVNPALVVAKPSEVAMAGSVK